MENLAKCSFELFLCCFIQQTQIQQTLCRISIKTDNYFNGCYLHALSHFAFSAEKKGKGKTASTQKYIEGNL